MRGRVKAGSFAAVAAAGAALVGCQKPPPPPPPAPPPLPAHLGPPPAARCSVSPFTVADGGTANVILTLGNDGGYCAATLTTAAGRPFDAPLMHIRPLHGHVSVVRYNGKTSVEYVPDPGFAGTDRFQVRLIIRNRPGYTTLNGTANVTRG